MCSRSVRPLRVLMAESSSAGGRMPSAERLPMCPRVQLLTEQRRKFAAARWKAWAAMDGWESQEQGLGEWAAFFDVVAKSKFLTGRAQGHNNDRPPFVADFDWLMRPTNFQKVFEGRYSDQRLAR